MAVKTVSLIKGSSNVVVTVQFMDINTGLPFSLAGFVSANAYFPPLDTTLTSIVVAGALVSSDLGQVSFTLSAAQLNSMAEGDQLDWEQQVDLGSRGFVSRIQSNLSISAREFAP